MILAVTGGRGYEDQQKVFEVLDAHAPTRVFVGDCPRGVDNFVERWCWSRKVPIMKFLADWDRLGRAAGPARNNMMLTRFREAGGKKLVAFPGGNGTSNCKRQAKAMELEVEEIS